jgi:hypothetical protein
MTYGGYGMTREQWPCSAVAPCPECLAKYQRLGRWPDDMGGVPISFCERDRIAADGP